MNKNNPNAKKELLFLKPIGPEMSVDEIFNNLIKVLKIKGIKFVQTKIKTNER